MQCTVIRNSVKRHHVGISAPVQHIVKASPTVQSVPVNIQEQVHPIGSVIHNNTVAALYHKVEILAVLGHLCIIKVVSSRVIDIAIIDIVRPGIAQFRIANGIHIAQTNFIPCCLVINVHSRLMIGNRCFRDALEASDIIRHLIIKIVSDSLAVYIPHRFAVA